MNDGRRGGFSFVDHSLFGPVALVDRAQYKLSSSFLRPKARWRESTFEQEQRRTHGVDYLDAHDRHWEDAELLFSQRRWANADHLYGLAAECGLKRLMQAFGMRFDKTSARPVSPEDRVHIEDV